MKIPNSFDVNEIQKELEFKQLKSALEKLVKKKDLTNIMELSNLVFMKNAMHVSYFFKDFEVEKHFLSYSASDLISLVTGIYFAASIFAQEEKLTKEQEQDKVIFLIIKVLLSQATNEIDLANSFYALDIITNYRILLDKMEEEELKSNKENKGE